MSPPGVGRQGVRRRTAARFAAVQALYQIELSGIGAEETVRQFIQHRLGETADDVAIGRADVDYFKVLVLGASARQNEIDDVIAAGLVPDWPLQRLEIILRAILRVGTFELMGRPDVAARVVINEHVDIAHAFFEGAEPGLVNGMLDGLARTWRAGELEEQGGDRSAEAQ